MNWALQYPVKKNYKQTKSYYLMLYNSRADVVRLLAERYDTKSNEKLVGFDPSFNRPTCPATLKSSNTTKHSVCRWQYIYIYSLCVWLFLGCYILIILVTLLYLVWKIFFYLEYYDIVLLYGLKYIINFKVFITK